LIVVRVFNEKNKDKRKQQQKKKTKLYFNRFAHGLSARSFFNFPFFIFSVLFFWTSALSFVE